jgi:hypothetical protein
VAVDFVEDPYIQIVSITVDERPIGAVVVFAEMTFIQPGFTDGARYRGKPGTEQLQDWALNSAYPHAFVSSSFALVPDGARQVPTFLLGTSTADERPGEIIPAEIHYSNDGEHWDVPFSIGLGEGGDLVGITHNEFESLVWHPNDKCFYALLSSILYDDGSYLQFRIYRSADGRTWSMTQEWIGSVTGDGDLVASAAAHAAFHALCIKPSNTGGGTRPHDGDGYAGYDEQKKIFIGPNYGDSADPVIIEIDGVRSPGGAGLPNKDGAIFVELVSFAGGIWNAIYPTGFGGAVHIYVSTDDGQNWQRIYETTGFQVYGLISADAADIESTEP